MRNAIAFASVISAATAFPWVATQAGVDTSLLRSGHAKRQQASNLACPFNANHVPAAPFNPDYPYNSAKNGQPGNGVGGYQVPAPGDTDHEYIAPRDGVDIRGPCPGLK